MFPLEYGPSDLNAQFIDQGSVVLSYVGVSVAAAVVLMFAFLGIRKGFAFFRGLADGRGGGDVDASWSPSNSYEAYEDGGHYGKEAYDSGNWAAFDSSRKWDNGTTYD